MKAVHQGASHRLVSLTVLLWTLSLPLPAQTNFSIIFSNGPPANRLNILLLSEGYTAAQLPQFLVDATNRANDFLAQEPYQEYRSYFNCFAVGVASAQSGSDHPSQSYYRNTYFNSSYDTAGLSRLISIPPNQFDSDASHGQGRVDALVNTFLPQCDLPILLVNDLLYGGSGGKVLMVSRSSTSTQIILHESGHTLGKLGDEYETPLPGYPDTEEPNTTRETRRDFIKWKAWLADSTPLPTPATGNYGNVVGLFEGAHYHSNGWYRPKLDCKMRTFTSDFCEVCREALVRAVYARVVPIESFSPAMTNFSWPADQPLVFSVQTFKPLTHSLNIEWYQDGRLIPGATGTNFTLAAKTFDHGQHTVTALVHDPTDWVRTDPTGVMQYPLTWTVDMNSRELRFEVVAATNIPPQVFAFQILGTTSTRFGIQASTNLSDWVFLSTNTLTGGQFMFVDTNFTPLMRNFYRAISLP